MIEQWKGPPETSLDSSRRRACYDERREATEEAARQGEFAATEKPPPPQLPKGLKRQGHARAQQMNVQRHSPPSRSTEVEREWRKPPGTQHQVHPGTPTPLILPP